MSTSPARRVLVMAGASTMAAALAMTMPLPAQAATTTTTRSAGRCLRLLGPVRHDHLRCPRGVSPICTTKTSFTSSNSTAKLTVPLVGSIGATNAQVMSSEPGHIDATTATAATSLLGGLVSATAMTSSAKVSTSGTAYTDTGSSTFVGLRIKLTSSSAGTQIGGLKINGVDQTTADVAENSRIDIAGVGTLYPLRAARRSSSLQFYALQLKLNTAQVGLASGTTLTVGSAWTGVTAS